MKRTSRDAVDVLRGTTRSLSQADLMQIIREMQDPDHPLPPKDRRASLKSGILRRHQAAELLSCCPKTVDNLAAQGILTKVRFPGRTRAIGVRREDVEALLGEDIS